MKVLYAGDVTEFRSTAKCLILSSRLSSWIEKIAARADAGDARCNLGLETVPMRRHRKM
ncbi:hypothetical protein HZB60_01760 [candidate division KSB1 bacterium]|nr:hypothetical protein [candidate division KSB1 bacterium]